VPGCTLSKRRVPSSGPSWPPRSPEVNATVAGSVWSATTSRARQLFPRYPAPSNDSQLPFRCGQVGFGRPGRIPGPESGNHPDLRRSVTNQTAQSSLRTGFVRPGRLLRLRPAPGTGSRTAATGLGAICWDSSGFDASGLLLGCLNPTCLNPTCLNPTCLNLIALSGIALGGIGLGGIALSGIGLHPIGLGVLALPVIALRP
jgi:hypothetical protein